MENQLLTVSTQILTGLAAANITDSPLSDERLIGKAIYLAEKLIHRTKQRPIKSEETIRKIIDFLTAQNADIRPDSAIETARHTLRFVLSNKPTEELIRDLFDDEEFAEFETDFSQFD